MKNTNLKGRWQVLQENPKVICDTAHNKEGLSIVLNQLEKESFKKIHFVLGVVSDKKLEEVLPLFPKKRHTIFVNQIFQEVCLKCFTRKSKRIWFNWRRDIFS